MNAVSPAGNKAWKRMETESTPSSSLDLQRYRTYLLLLARSHDKMGGEEASDLVQKTMLAAHAQRAEFRGGSPAELAVHLRHVERRWLEWGFLGLEVDDPWADEQDGRWRVPAGMDVAEVGEQLRRQGARSRSIVAAHRLDEVGQPGPRWRGAEPATLERVLFHLVQEYARHLGQLDIVVELVTGRTGE